MTKEQLDVFKLSKAVYQQFAAGTYKLTRREHKLQLACIERWVNESQDAWETVWKKKVEGGGVEGGKV